MREMALHSRSYRFTTPVKAVAKPTEPEPTFINNINVTALLATVQKLKENPEAGRVHVTIKANMNASEGLARVKLPAGELVTAWPRVFGGRGQYLSPQDLCSAGLSGCFTGTFMVLLAQAGVHLAADSQIETSLDWNFEGLFNPQVRPFERADVNLLVTSANKDNDLLLRAFHQIAQIGRAHV